MTELYRIDPGQGRFTVQAFATGMLGMLGHDPTFAVRDFAGTIRLEDAGARGMSMDLTVQAGSLDLIDRVKAADRDEIVGRMHRNVLESANDPKITFRTVEVAGEPAGPGHYRLFLGGRLTLRGVTHPQGADADLVVLPDRLHLRGACALAMSAYRIKPVTALGGAIKLKDELTITFDLVASPEGP